MSSSKFTFDAKQPFQLDAISSVVDLFDGQPLNAGLLMNNVSNELERHPAQPPLDIQAEIGAIGNNLVIGRELVLANLQRIQDRNGIEVVTELAGRELEFDIEMETGTGKTYVYLRTVFELARRYRFTKFIILVPSVAVREGVRTSIQLMKEHFRSLYPDLPFDAMVYRGENPSEVQSFATSTSVQIMVMTIASIRGDKNTRIIHQYRDTIIGRRPIDFLNATHPIVIMDEPQNMETELSQSSIRELGPAFTLRYSATHKTQRNVVYRLDPVAAHDLGLVKKIVVADVHQVGGDVAPYIKVLGVKRDPWVAKLELACRKADGTLGRKAVSVKPGQELSEKKVTDNAAYEHWKIDEMSIEPPAVKLSRHGELREGESIGGHSEWVFRQMIRETVRQHFKKAAELKSLGIKVLSLFFVDKVASFIGTGSNNQDADGSFVQWFDEAYEAERKSRPEYEELFPYSAADVRKAYFAQLKSKGAVTFVESNEERLTAKDDGAFELIMQDKQRLLDENEPVRFIFSHSALKEGWDNPNVFQICSLREMGAEVERRQTIGRGLRLPVARTEQGYIRVTDSRHAVLTVVANETFNEFANNLQKEYQSAGVSIGTVRESAFAKLYRIGKDGALTDEPIGFKKSAEIFKHLVDNGFIKEGLTTDRYKPDTLGFDLGLPSGLAHYQSEIIKLIEDCNFQRYVRKDTKPLPRKLNKELFEDKDFNQLWEKISSRTLYRVSLDSGRLIENVLRALEDAEKVQPLRIVTTYTGIEVLRGGTKGNTLSEGRVEVKGTFDLPDIVGELQAATSLTRTTIIDVLIKSKRLDEFIGNPNDFIAMVRKVLTDELAKLVIDGIQYEKIGGSIYELTELKLDGEKEKAQFLSEMYKVKNQEKTDFDYIPYDSKVEEEFARRLDNSDDIKMFMKLPAKFKVPTPVGFYNPDWAIVKGDQVYMIRETKSTMDKSKLRPTELAKIRSARKHFEAIGVDYAQTAPPNWNP